MADIFEEVEEGIRQDRLTRAWKKYGIFAYLAAGLLIGGVAFFEYSQDRQQKALVSSAMELEAALGSLESGNYEAAGNEFSTLAASKARLAPVAAQFLAEVRLDGNGDAAAATQVLQQASEGDDAINKLALMKAAYLQADALNRNELESLLGPLREDEGAFGALAVELIAAKALEEGDIAYARSEFNYLLVAANAPPGVAVRARQALATMPAAPADPMMTNEVAETPEATTPTPAEETGE